VTTPPAQPEIDRSKYQPREFNATRRVPSSYPPVPPNRDVGKRWDVYRKQLASLFRRIALWEPRSMTPTPILPPTPLPDSLQGAFRDAPQVPADPLPNTGAANQAPLPSSNRSSRPTHDSAVRKVETTVQLQSQAHPLPDAHLSRSLRNHDTAWVPELPPVCVPVSPSTHNEGTLVSSPAQPKIGTSSSEPHEHNRTGRAPSAYRPVPLKKSMSAQLLSHSGTPTPSSHTTGMVRTMSASGPAPGAGPRDRPRKHPPTTQGTSQAQVADGDDNQLFTSALRTILSHQNRYAPGLYLVTNNRYNC